MCIIFSVDLSDVPITDANRSLVSLKTRTKVNTLYKESLDTDKGEMICRVINTKFLVFSFFLENGA